MLNPAFAALSLALAATAAQAVPSVVFSPADTDVRVGETFDLLLSGLAFDVTAAGAAIVNVTGGQKLDFSFSNQTLELLAVVIDPRWTFSSGNKTGSLDAAYGRLTGLAFGNFPATADDDFRIATFTLRALAPGEGRLTLLSGQFIGFVGSRAGQLIAPTLGEASFQVGSVPEPGAWALMLAGLGALALGLQRR